MTPEGKIEVYLKRQVKETGGEIRKLSWIGRRGAPDRFVFWPPIFAHIPICAFVEVKRLGEKATPQQAREHDRLRAAGFDVVVLDCVAAVDAFIDRMVGKMVT